MQQRLPVFNQTGVRSFCSVKYLRKDQPQGPHLVERAPHVVRLKVHAAAAAVQLQAAGLHVNLPFLSFNCQIEVETPKRFEEKLSMVTLI